MPKTKPTPWPTIESLLPPDTPRYMMPAWLGCLSWAAGRADIVAAFRKDTGNQWRPAKTPFQRQLDESCGVDREFVLEFVQWVNVNVWGPVDGVKS